MEERLRQQQESQRQHQLLQNQLCDGCSHSCRCSCGSDSVTVAVIGSGCAATLTDFCCCATHLRCCSLFVTAQLLLQPGSKSDGSIASEGDADDEEEAGTRINLTHTHTHTLANGCSLFVKAPRVRSVVRAAVVRSTGV